MSVPQPEMDFEKQESKSAPYSKTPPFHEVLIIKYLSETVNEPPLLKLQGLTDTLMLSQDRMPKETDWKLIGAIRGLADAFILARDRAETNIVSVAFPLEIEDYHSFIAPWASVVDIRIDQTVDASPNRFEREALDAGYNREEDVDAYVFFESSRYFSVRTFDELRTRFQLWAIPIIMRFALQCAETLSPLGKQILMSSLLSNKGQPKI